MTPSPTRRAILALAIVLLAAPRAAHAYLDPGSGSYILQILVAGLVAVSFAVKTFWTTLRGFFSGLLGRRSSRPSDHD